MLRRLYLIIALMYLWVSTGCIALVVGAGAGAGTYAYVNGQLSRTYQANYQTTYDVCKGILGDMKQSVLEENCQITSTNVTTKMHKTATISVTPLFAQWLRFRSAYSMAT